MEYGSKRRGLGEIGGMLRRHLAVRGLRFAVDRGWDRWAAYFVRACCQPIPVPWSSPRTLWLLGKDGANEDLLTVLEQEGIATPVDLVRGVPKAIAGRFLPPGLDDNNYSNQPPAVEARKDRYREVWRGILRALPTARRPAAIVTGNFGYFAERELASAAEAEGLPFLALHKECLKSPGRVAFFKTVYQRRGVFGGRKVLVYNHVERDLQIDAGVVRPEQITVCGMPRLDRLHQWRLAHGPRPAHPPTLLAFGFYPHTGLPRIPRKGVGDGATTYEYLSAEQRDLDWGDFFRGYHEALVKLARDHPGWRVRLKLKGRLRDSKPAIDWVESLGRPENLELVVGGDPFEHLVGADVVCGFNSTAVLEGLAAGLPVVTPAFAEALDDALRPFAVSFGAATDAPDSAQALHDSLAHHMRHPASPATDLTPARAEVLDHWVGNADGQSGARVRAAIQAEFPSPVEPVEPA